MLLRLRVKNFGIIEDFDWEPGSGFNVLTGETGAGKSLVVDAVNSLVSGRLEETAIRHGADEARIEGVFSVCSLDETMAFLKEKGIDPGDDGLLIISLSLKRGGRAVIRLNDNTFPRSVLSEVGRKLIDIHGQSQHLSLLDRSSHLDYLDACGGTMKLRREFGTEVQLLNRLEGEIAALTISAADRVRQQDYLTFQVNEINSAALSEREDSDLENERLILGSAEKLRALTFDALQALDGEDPQGDSPAVSQVNRALTSMEKLTEIDNSLSAQADIIREINFNLSDIVSALRTYYSTIESDPHRLEEIELRLGQIRDLKRKYGGSISEILAFAEKARCRLEEFESYDRRIESLKIAADSCRIRLATIARELSSKRSEAAIRLEKSVNTELTDLNMEKVHFYISLGVIDQKDGLLITDERTVGYNARGIDQVEFLASTNPGEPAKALEKIASTGELSRFTLAIKTALSQADKSPVLIFDEIDIGVGGRSGDIIGRKLAFLGKEHQVICVTHLPQIASYANHHFRVGKVTSGGRVSSRLEKIIGEDRIKELALMLSGDTSSKAGPEGAKELLDKAGQFIKSLMGC